MEILNIPKIMETLLLVLALSLDAFVASFAYGTNKIKVPTKSATVINIVCSFILGLSLFIGKLAANIIPTSITSIICCLILCFLGISKLFDFTIKTWIKKNNGINPKITIRIMDFRFLLQVYCDNTKADVDASKVLTIKESFALALALSLDGIAAGFGAGLVDINYMETIVFSFILGMLAVFLGGFVGNKIADKTNLNLSWISGAILILLGIGKLL